MSEQSAPSPKQYDEQKEAYAYGYASALTTQLHAIRTATTHAHFFFPHLQVGMHILDCGCGSGGVTVGLAQAVAPGEVIGVDISAAEIEMAIARAADLHLTNLQFEVQDVHRLPYPDESFDAVFAHNVLEHVADPTQVIHEMKRVLKAGGLIGVRDIDFGGHIVQPPTR